MNDPYTAETAAKLRESTSQTVTPGGHEGPITCVAVHPDGGSFFTVGLGGRVVQVVKSVC